MQLSPVPVTSAPGFVDYRMDTASARAFLGDYVTLP
jgi:hypothetical protein